MIQKLLLFVRSLFLKFNSSSSERSFIPSLKLLCVAMFFVNFSYSQKTWDGSASNNWNANNNWTPSGVPTATDDVIIPNGVTGTITINTDAVCKNFTINGGGTTNNVTISAGNSLTVSGVVTINAGSTNGVNKILNVGTSSLTCTAIAIAATTSTTRTSGITLSSGIVTSSGNITMGNNNFFNFSGSGVLNVGGNMSGGTFTSSTGTVNYNRSGNQTVGSYNYYNLTLSGSGAKTTSGVAVNGTLSMEDAATVSTAVTYGGASTLQYNTITNRTAGNEWPATFAGTGGVAIKNTGIITLNNAKNVANNFSIDSGAKVNLGSFTHSVGTLILNNSSTVAGSWGSNGSTAVNKSNTYFDASSSGIVNAGCTFNFAAVAPITNVRLNTLNNPSSASSTTAYEDFASSSSTTLIRGQSYTISVNGNTYNGNYNFYYTAFVDWNQDGDFDDSGEYYAIGTISNSTGSDGKIASVYFPIPNGAVLGNTRMRIISHYNSYNTTPCSSVDGNSFGQVEDYLITVQDVCSVAPAPGNTVTSAASVCPGTPFTLSLQNTLADGTTYVWQTSPDGNAPWTNALPTPSTFFSSTFSTAQSANTTVGNISLYGNDTSITGGELLLTKLNTSYYGGFVIQSTPGININAFTTKFDYKIYGGTGADGLSLSYAPTVVNNAGNGEGGEGSGIILQLDSYDNEGIATGSRVRILYNGSSIFSSAINVPFNIRTSSARNVVLSVDNNGKLSLSIGGTTVVSNLTLPANYLSSDKSNWKFKFSARTGASTDNHVIDNLTINYLDVASTNPTFTTSQTVPTYYRALVTCGSTVDSAPVFVNVTSAVINPMTASVCTALAFTVTPANGTNGTIPSGTTYSWGIPTVTGSMTGGAASTGSPINISGTLVNSTGSPQTATYTVTPTSGGCIGMPFTLTVTVNPLPTAPIVTTVQPTCSVNTGTITITAPTGTGTSYSINGSTYTNTTGIFAGLAVGPYNVTARNSSGCTSPITVVNINAATVKTWTGATDTKWNLDANWSPDGIPTASDCVVIPNVTRKPIISGTGISGVAQALTVNANALLSVFSSNTLTVTNEIKVAPTGSLVFENHSSLLQLNDSPTINTGDITYKRITPQIRVADFTYWSTPVSSQTLLGVSPLTLFDKYFGFDGDGWVGTNSSTIMTVGKGYIIRGPQSYSRTVKADYEASFIGVPNNGNLSGETLRANKYYLIGNPYPSALDAAKFLAANTFLKGTLYFWTHNTAVVFAPGYIYNSDDYAVYNLTGGTGTYAAPSGSIPGNNPAVPSGKIAAGQSFFASAGTSGGTVTFNNSMRSGATDNTQFFKPGTTSKGTEANRVWLNMTNDGGAFKQLLVGYVDGATNEFDKNYDGLTFNGNAYIDFYSFSNDNKYVIQGRALPFSDADIISLGYRTTIEGDFTISIDGTDGSLSNQNIYLEDKTTGKVHDLTAGNYTFKTAIGTFTDRLVLRYTNKTLGIGDIENPDNNLIVTVKDKVVKVTSTNENIKQVTIFDITGKLLYDKNKVGATELQLQNLPFSNQVLLVKVILENDSTTTKKIIFK
ncbi:T9SS sorting signal type C domain-containing protein [Flavobacterium psychroterrae]|uniref:T9SS sorting signal type C domain-containing protein n=1 Tax=Flavobacterium psychroterrae TaxID=2133767 RepID=A0ABS5PE06_9FLAO|nr:GEVED domain-containing protein [Flavobacterium psychroterrae]MBS7232527.1 T9SS sorting signal type C domain-containing protein [Flavobacterium psychroterrae]